VVEAINVTKRYGGKTVVDRVSVRIQPGAVTSFIGPNGAGKSTLLSMIVRLLTKDEGEVLIDGRELSRYSSNELAKKISILKQSNQINIRLTVKELVSFGRFPYSQGRLTKEDLQHVDEAIDYMDLGDLRDRYLDELSGGQKQRAYIAMVLAQNTEYIFLDEPLNNLDMKHSVQIMKILRKLVEELGKTIVLVLHDINFASCYSDRIVALKDGRVVKDGTTDELIQSDVLKELYEMDIPIQMVDGQRMCIYFS
jgi:iron complex transport system ATP-binding protein